MAGEPTLQQGSDQEDWVRYMQETLEQIGYDLGEDSTSGTFGSGTEVAVRQFQENNVDAYGRQLAVDGSVSARTWSCITQTGEIEGEDRPTEESQSDQFTDNASADAASGGQRYDYDQPVNHVSQQTDNTCWAACCAMLLGTTEEDVIARVGNAGGDGADEPEMTVIASSLGLQMPGGRCQGPDGWHEMMKNNGPIMVGIPRHYIVLAGIRSDGTTANTEFHVYDPAQSESWMGFDSVNSAYEIDADAGANLLTR